MGARKKKLSQWIKADGTAETVSPQGKKWSLPEIQKMVGGYFEIILHTRLKAGLVLLVNEDGRSLGLPDNAQASAAAGQRIVGDALIVPAELM